MDTLLIGILFVIAVLVAPSLIDKVKEVVSKEEKGEKSEVEKEQVEKEVKVEKAVEEKEKSEVQERESKEDTTSIESLDIEKTNIVGTGGEETVKSITQDNLTIDNLTIDTSDIDAELGLEGKEEKEKEVKLEKTEEVEGAGEGVILEDKDNLLVSLEKVIETEEEEEIDLLRDLKGQKFNVEELQAELEDVLEKLNKIKVNQGLSKKV